MHCWIHFAHFQTHNASDLPYFDICITPYYNDASKIFTPIFLGMQLFLQCHWMHWLVQILLPDQLASSLVFIELKFNMPLTLTAMSVSLLLWYILMTDPKFPCPIRPLSSKSSAEKSYVCNTKKSTICMSICLKCPEAQNYLYYRVFTHGLSQGC